MTRLSCAVGLRWSRLFGQVGGEVMPPVCSSDHGGHVPHDRLWQRRADPADAVMELILADETKPAHCPAYQAYPVSSKMPPRPAPMFARESTSSIELRCFRFL